MAKNVANDNLVEVYRTFDARCATQLDKVHSKRRYELSVFVPSPDALKAEERELERLLDEASALSAPDPVFSLLKTHFGEFLKTQISALRRLSQSPNSFVGSLTNVIGYMTRKDSRSPEERAKILLTRLGHADELWSGIKTLLKTATKEKLALLVDACDGLKLVADNVKKEVPQAYRGLSEASIAEIQKSLERISEKATAWREEASRLLESKEKDSGPGVLLEKEETEEEAIERYRSILWEELGISLDELLSWYEDEVNKTRSGIFETAKKINLGGIPEPKTIEDVVYLLNTYEGPCDTPDEMFARMRNYLKRAQTAAREYVRLPEESCRVVPTPENLRGHYPWGGYGGGCPRRRPLLGEVFLNDHNYKAVTDGWIKMNAVHECYPGHHVQWVRSVLDPLPETVKVGAKSVPTLEGAAHRSERLTEHIFPEDPFYPLFVSYRRHHTSVRIKADLTLFYFRRPVEEAVDLNVKELGFDRNTARGQVKSQQITPGYFTCYYYGLKRLTDLQAKFGYDDKTFTEIIFSLPHVSLATLEKFLALSEPDKHRFLTGFPSLVTYD